MLNFDTLSRALQQADAGLPAAEVHGLLSALVCVPGGKRLAVVQGEVLGPRLDEPQSQHCRAMLEDTWDATVAALDAGDFGFDLMLPDDAQPLLERTEALGAWCAGFLAGLGLAGVRGHEQRFSEDAHEFLVDLQEMSRIEADPEDSEEGETAFAELVEYLRVGVMLLREELGAAVDTAALGRLH